MGGEAIPKLEIPGTLTASSTHPIVNPLTTPANRRITRKLGSCGTGAKRRRAEMLDPKNLLGDRIDRGVHQIHHQFILRTKLENSNPNVAESRREAVVRI